MILLIHIFDGIINFIYALTGLCRDKQNRSIGHIGKTFPHAQGIFLHGVSIFFHQIPLVYDDDTRFSCIVCLSSHLGILLGNAFCGINHNHADICTLYRHQRTHDRKLLDFLLYLGFAPNPRRINESELPILVIELCIDAVARCARNIGYDYALLSQNLIEQRGLSNIGLTDERHTNPVCIFINAIFRRKILIYLVQQVARTITMQCGNSERLSQSQIVKFIKFRLGLSGLITFVDCQHNWFSAALQHSSNINIRSGNTSAQIGDKNNHICVMNGCFCLITHKL